MNQLHRVSVLGVPAGSKHEEVEAGLCRLFPGVGITGIEIHESNTVVTLESVNDAQKFSKLLPAWLEIGSQSYKISQNVTSDRETDCRRRSRAEAVQSSVCIDCDRLNTWTTVKRIPPGGKQGILLLDVPHTTSPEKICEYFRRFCASSVDSVSHILNVRDGVFVAFYDESVVKCVLEKKTHTIDGCKVTILPKRTPEYWSNKLLIKADTDIKTRLLKWDLAATLNLDQKFVEVEEIGERKFIASIGTALVNFPRESNIRGVREIVRLMKSDCLMIKAPKRIIVEQPDVLLEIIGNPLITKKNRVDEDGLLLYFSNFEDAESILEKFAKNPMTVENEKIFISRYLHKFGEGFDTLPAETVDRPQQMKGPIEEFSQVQYQRMNEIPENEDRQDIRPVDRPQSPDVERADLSLESNRVEILGLDRNCNLAKLKSFLQKKLRVPIAKIMHEDTKTSAFFQSSEDATDFRSVFPHEIEYSFGTRKYKLNLETVLDDEVEDERNVEPSFCEDSTLPPSEQSTPPSFTISHIDTIHTWYSQPPELEDCNKMGIVAFAEKECPERVIAYFKDLSAKNETEIEYIMPMVDGIFISFQNPKVAEVISQSSDHGDAMESLFVFVKRIPEYFSDKILMKKTPKQMGKNIQMLSVKNFSSKGIKPKSIQKIGQEASMVQYEDEMDLENLLDIIKESKKSLKGREWQLSLLPKPDCLEVEIVNGNDLEGVQAILENEAASDCGKVTRFDKVSSTTALVYFSDYRNVEEISRKFEAVPLKFEDLEYNVTPYYHCFSNKHNRLFQPNVVDQYYRRHLEHMANRELLFQIQDEAVWKFLLKKTENLEVLRSDVEKIASVKVHDEEPCLTFSPLLFRGSDLTETKDVPDFEDSCHQAAGKFLLLFKKIDHVVDKEKLAEVRKIHTHKHIAEDYEASDQDDISVSWSENVVSIVGLRSRVDSFIDSVNQIVDITSRTMELNPAKYKWIMETEVFIEVATKFEGRVKANTIDEQCQIEFSGPKEQITDMKLDILTHLEKAMEKKLVWNDSRISFLVNIQSAPTAVMEIFQKSRIKAILYVYDGYVSIWAYGEQMEGAVKLVEESLLSESIKLKTEAHSDVTLQKQWKELVDQRQADCKQIIKMEKGAVVVAGFRNSVVESVPILEKFLADRLELCEIMLMDYIKACHVEQFCQSHLQSLSNLKWFIDHDKKGIALIGSSHIIEEAKQVLTPLVQEMKVKNHQIDKHAIVEFFLANQTDILLTAKSQNQCAILVRNFDWPSKMEWPNSTNASLSKTPYTLAFGFLTVYFLERDIAWDDSDAVVSVNDKSCHGNYPELSTGIWVKSVADHPTKKFLHISSPHDANQISSSVVNLLTGADGLKCEVLSMPLLRPAGSIKDSIAAEKMFDGFTDFIKVNKATKSLKQVRVLVHGRSRHKEIVKHLSSIDAAVAAPQSSENYSASFHPVQFQALHSSDDEDSSSGTEEQIDQPKSHIRQSPLELQSSPARPSTIGSLDVSVRQWDITKDKNDIIVNSIGSSFELIKGGAISKIIANKGGPDIQKEMSKLPADRKMKVTTGGNLPCKKIIHVDAPQDATKLESCVVNLLKKADELPHSSISLPAIGTGGLGIPVNVAAQEAMKGVVTFSRIQPQTRNLKVVDFVIFDMQMVPVYQRYLSSYVTGNGQNPSLTGQNPTSMGPNPISIAPNPTSTGPNPTSMSKFPLNVAVKQGSITDENYEMIVNSLGNDFNLSKAGAVSKEILLRGGQDIQKTLTAAKGSQIRVTDAGKLSCKKILHVATPNDVMKLKDLMKSILYEAENQQMKSLSVPAIGTGGLGFPPPQAAEQLFNGMLEFCKNTTTKYLKNVNIVVFESRMIADFKGQLLLLPQKYSTAGAVAKRNMSTQDFTPRSFSSLQVSVRHGDITQEKNDMIVNSLGSEFLLAQAGVVSKAILDKGGSKIQDELSARSGVELRVTSGGNLNCKKILHLATPRDVEKLKIAVFQLLTVADAEGCKSISIPALGTGGLGLSSREVAKVLLGQISKFSRRFSAKSLKIIDIVVFQTSMVQDFKDELVHSNEPTTSRTAAFKSEISKVPAHVIRGVRKKVGMRKKTEEKGEKTLLLDGIQVNVCKGKITGRKCDVLVHNTNRSFDLHHGKNFSNLIYGTWKNEIKSELQHSKDKFLRETSCGIPSSKKIFHVFFPSKSQEEELKKAFNQLFSEVVRKGYDSVSMYPPCDGKISGSFLGAVADFSKARPNNDQCFTINLFGIDSKIMKRLHEIVLEGGRTLPGAKIHTLESLIQNSLMLQLCGHEASIDEAITQIESKIKSSYHEEHIPCQCMETVKQRKWDYILEIKDTHKVNIKHLKQSDGVDSIIVEGIKENVLAASMLIKEILNDLSKAENVMKLGNYFWQYKKVDGKNWEAFQAVDNVMLEEFYQGVKKQEELEEGLTMFVDNDQREFEINIQDMKLSGYRDVEIRREVIQNFPKNWTDMGSETMMEVNLQPSDPDYDMVAKKFLKTKESKPRTILSITRLQNKGLYQVFETNRNRCKLHCKEKQLSRYLFHGTTAESLEEICKVGFDRIYSGSRVGAIHGRGNYFAVEADYSAKGYASADRSGICCMFLAEVITGDFAKGDPGMKNCPKKQWAGHVPYESLVDNISNPQIFVVFHDAAAYPSFVIKFKQ